MEYSYRIDTVNRAIVVAIVGELYANDFAKLDVEVCSLALGLNYKLVFNFKKAIIRIGLGEAYFWFPDHLDKINMSFRQITSAHIANDTDESFFCFVETTWSNRGVRTKMFKEEKAALKWLKQF